MFKNWPRPFMREIGPLPVIVWIGLGLVAILVVAWFIRGQQRGTPATGSTGLSFSPPQSQGSPGVYQGWMYGQGASYVTIPSVQIASSGGQAPPGASPAKVSLSLFRGWPNRFSRTGGG